MILDSPLRRTVGIIALFALCEATGFAQTPVVSIRAADPLAVEKSAATTGSDTAAFTVSRAGSAAGALVVNVTAGGNAVLAADFTVSPTGATTAVTIPAGKSSVVVVVIPVDNSIAQDERVLTLTVVSGAGYSVGSDAAASVYLQDMDKAGSSTYTGNADLFYSYKIYTTTYGSQAAKIAVPTFRGVDVPVVRVMAEGVYPAWLARWAYESGVAFYTANNWNQSLDHLPALATASGHPEVVNAMHIGIGVSSGATGACQLADKFSSRAVFSFGITNASADYSPSLTTYAEFDDAYKFHAGTGGGSDYGGINITENRCRHTYSYDLGEQKLFFYDKFVKLRADYQPGVAGRDPVIGQMVGKTVDYSRGYIGEARFGREFFNYATWEAHTIPVADYNKVTGTEAVDGSWLPDAATAAAWRAFTNRGENHCAWDFPQLGFKDDMASNNTMVCMVNTAQTQPCTVDTGLFADADLCEFYDNETLVATAREARTDAGGRRVFDHTYSWDESRLGPRVLHAVLVNSTTSKRVQVALTRVVYVVPHRNDHNTAPTITPVSAITVDAPATATTIDIPFTVGDAEAAPESLIVKFGKPEEAMMKYTPSDFTGTVSGTGANRTLSIALDPATVNKGGVLGGVLMVGDGELSANAYVTIKVRKPGSAPFFHSIQSIGSMPFVGNEVGYDETATSGEGMSMCVVVNGWSKEWSITVRDWDTDPRDLTLTALSNTPATLPNENIIVGGYGPYRTLQVRPISYGTQDTSLTLYLSDGASQVTRTYTFRIIENQNDYLQSDDYKNTAPHIGCIPDQTAFSGEQSPRVLFQIGDYHTPSEDLGAGNVRLQVSAYSDNQSVLPNSSIFVGDAGQKRWITMRPPEGVSGAAHVTVVVTDEGGLNASSQFQVTVGKALPVLDSDGGTSETVAGGTPKSFSVSARGGELSYQWYLGASGDTSHPIPGATGPTLDAGALAQSGQYWCRISNSVGHTDSATRTVSVIAAAPVITSQPQSQSANEGGSALLSVVAGGDGLSYQWFAGASGNTSAPVVGATGSSMEAGAANGASYWCRVSNLIGSVDSESAVIATVGWYAYHDLYTTAQISDGNHANVSEGSVSGTAYSLENFATGNSAGPTITFTDNGTRTAQTTGANPFAGTEAHALFNGKIGVGAKSDKMTAPSSCRVTFSGLDPGRKYSVAFYACRNSFTNQSQFTIENASGYEASSSTGVTLGGTNGNTTAVVEAGATADTDGRVVRWDGITPSANGGTSFSVLINKSPLSGASNDFILPQATMLREYLASPPVIVSATPSVSIAPGGQATFSVTAPGSGISYQWYRGASGDTSSPIAWDSSSGTYTTEYLASGASYWVRVSGGGSSVDSGTFTATVDPALLAPVITAQPADVTCEETRPAVFSVVAASATGYQWRKDGTPIPGATAASCEIAPTSPASAGSYDCVVSNASGSATSRAAKLTVQPGRPPVLLTQPSAWHYRRVDEGAAADSLVKDYNGMHCYASGTGPLTFQWRKDGVPIPESDSIYLYDQSTFESRIWFSSDSGVYDCVVSNAFGSVTSESVFGVINYNESLHAGGVARYVTSFSPDSGTPKMIDVVAGGSVTLDAVVQGGTGVLVFGERDSYYSTAELTRISELTTATNPNHYYHFSHTIPDVGSNPLGYAAGDTRQKSYEFESPGSETNYSRTTLSFKAPTAPDGIVNAIYNYIGAAFVPTYYYMPKTLAVGEPVYAVGMTSTGTAPFTYQWYKDGAAIPGATTAVYIDNDMQPADAGNYHVVISNSQGSYTAPAITWRVSPEHFFISSQPQNVTTSANQTASFSVVTTGATPTSYQWKRNNIVIPGATEATYAIPSTSPVNAGRYTCVIERTWLEWDADYQEWFENYTYETSNPADLVVIVPPTIADQPRSQTVSPGQTVNFSVSAVGSLDITQPEVSGGDTDFTYQWRKNGIAIAGATRTTLAIASASESDEGNYDCVVTSTLGAGSVTSAPAALDVLLPPPSFVSQSEGVVINQGAGTTLSVTATGASLTYQWYLGALGDMSRPISGATGSTLNTGELAATSFYWVQIANPGGVVSSRGIGVGVTPPTPPTITDQPEGTVLPVGGSTTLSVSANGTSPFSYQWKKNGTIIPGATTAALALTNVTSAATGAYTCTVGNLFGSANSLPATVVVSSAPLITAHPSDAVISQNQTATLELVASGSLLAYQWYAGASGFTDAPVAGATSAIFTTPALASTASYWCRVSNADGAADSNTATVRLPNWEAYHDTVELVDNGGTNATQNAALLTSAPTTSVPVVTTLKNFVSGADLSGRTLTQSRSGSVPTVATTNSASIAPAAGTDAHKLFGGKIVLGQKIYQIAGGSSYTFAFSGLDSSKRYAVAFFASRDDSRYTVKTKLTLLGASAWINVSSNGTTALAGTNDAVVEVDVCAGSAAAGRVIRWNDIAIAGSTFSVKAELGSGGSSFVVPQCVALIEYDVTTKIAAPTITTQPIGASIASGGTQTLTVAAAGSGLSYQWYQGMTGDTSAPVGGATSSSITTPALVATTSYWVRVSNQSGSQLSHAATVEVAAPPPAGFSAWTASHGLAGGNGAAGADPDGDGVPNLLEFAFGDSPVNRAESRRPQIEIPPFAATLDLTFHRARQDVRYIVESSTTLAPGSWAVEYAIEKNADPGSLGADVVVPVPLAGETKKFLRIRVEE